MIKSLLIYISQYLAVSSLSGFWFGFMGFNADRWYKKTALLQTEVEGIGVYGKGQKWIKQRNWKKLGVDSNSMHLETKTLSTQISGEIKSTLIFFLLTHMLSCSCEWISISLAENTCWITSLNYYQNFNNISCQKYSCWLNHDSISFSSAQRNLLVSSYRKR